MKNKIYSKVMYLAIPLFCGCPFDSEKTSSKNTVSVKENKEKCLKSIIPEKTKYTEPLELLLENSKEQLELNHNIPVPNTLEKEPVKEPYPYTHLFY